MSSLLVEADGIGYRAGGRWWLRPTLHLAVAAGEVHLLTGVEGSGKSTALRLLGGLVPLSSGEAWVGGVNLRRHPRRVRRVLGYAPQQLLLPQDETPRQLLRLHAALVRPWRPGRRSAVKAVVADLLELFGLVNFADQPVGRLTPGARQAISLARALVGEPQVLLLDDPLQHLTAERTADMLQLVQEMAAMGKAVLVATGEPAPWDGISSGRTQLEVSAS